VSDLPVLLAATEPISLGPYEAIVARLTPPLLFLCVLYGLFVAVRAVFGLFGSPTIRNLELIVAKVAAAIIVPVVIVLLLRYWVDLLNWVLSIATSAADGSLSLPDAGGSESPAPSTDPLFPTPPAP
jgi:hypothetical protein